MTPRDRLSVARTGRRCRRFRPGRAWIALAAALLTPACATLSASCDGMVGLANLECRSASGDKQAQLALGIAFEEGQGVPRDPRRAAKLYRAAARYTSGTTYVYSPPVGKAPAQVLPVSIGPDVPGLPEAMLRLARLYEQGLGVKRDEKKAALWRERAMR